MELPPKSRTTPALWLRVLGAGLMLVSAATSYAQGAERWTSPDGVFSIQTPAAQWRYRPTTEPERKMEIWSVGSTMVISCTVLQTSFPAHTAGATQAQLNAGIRRPTRDDAQRASPSFTISRYEFQEAGPVTILVQEGGHAEHPTLRIRSITFVTPGAAAARMHRVECATDRSAPPADIERIETLFKSLQFLTNGTRT